jgi:hypothetical protein
MIMGRMMVFQGGMDCRAGTAEGLPAEERLEGFVPQPFQPYNWELL